MIRRHVFNHTNVFFPAKSRNGGFSSDSLLIASCTSFIGSLCDGWRCQQPNMILYTSFGQFWGQSSRIPLCMYSITCTKRKRTHFLITFSLSECLSTKTWKNSTLFTVTSLTDLTAIACLITIWLPFCIELLVSLSAFSKYTNLSRSKINYKQWNVLEWVNGLVSAETGSYK